MAVDVQEFKRGMRQLASAVCVITTCDDATRNGLTATAVMSLTAEPPQVGVAVNKTAIAFPMLAASGRFAVNVLARDQHAVAEVFSGAGGLKGASRFESGAGTWSTGVTGAPLLDDATVSLDCSVAQQIDLGTHVLFVGLVESVRADDERAPLLFLDGGWADLSRRTIGAPPA